MEKELFKTTIQASPEKVWNVLWNDATYRLWTAPFDPGSHAETDWKKGSKILFLGNKQDGMVSIVAENIANEFMSIKHLGIVKDGVEDLDSPDAKIWAGAFENYTLNTVNGKTELTIDLITENGIPEEFKGYFLQAWPKALDKLKELSEAS